MPHDRNNQLVEPGDSIRFIDYMKMTRVGVVAAITSTGDTCNLSASVLMPGRVDQHTLSAKDTELVAKYDGRSVGVLTPNPPTPVSPPLAQTTES